jgi:hypothetical protein
MKYLSHVGLTHKAKSKIEMLVQEFLLQNDRLLIEYNSVEDFKNSIISHINFMRQENKRCKVIKLNWFSFGQKDFGLNGISSIDFRLYEIKGVAEFNLNQKL